MSIPKSAIGSSSGLFDKMSGRDVKRSLLAALSLLFIAILTVFPPPNNQAHARIPPKYYGVNLASAEFAPGRIPGVHGKDYIYPTGATAEPFRKMGMNTLRLPVLWERLQPTALGELDPAEIARLDATIAALGEFDAVIIDIHNYARYGSVALDHPSRPGAMLPDLWSRLANRYKNSPKVAFGLMNEPHDISGPAWRRIADQTVSAIRKTGAKNLILVPGVNWTGGHNWDSGGKDSSASAMAGLVDPLGNTIFEVHQYLDANSSGQGETCAGKTVGRARLINVTKWLRREGAKGFLAEFGASANPDCVAALDDLLAFLAENGDVWVGWTYWAGGDWWGDYPFGIQPSGDQVKPQSTILARHISTYQDQATIEHSPPVR